MPLAVDTYQELEKTLGIRCWYPKTIHRLLVHPQDEQTLKKKQRNPLFARYIRGDRYVLPHASGVVSSCEGIDIVGGGFVDAGKLVAAMRTWLQEQDAWVGARIAPGEVSSTSHGVTWGGIHYDAMVLTTGWRLQEWFSEGAPVHPNRGVLLHLKLPSLRLDKILKGKHYLLPMGNGRFILGATYLRGSTDLIQTQEARKHLMDFLKRHIQPPHHLEKEQVGIRPTTRDHWPLLDRHPDSPAIRVLSGFGSRGLLYAPLCAKIAADHLEGAAIPDDLLYKR